MRPFTSVPDYSDPGPDDLQPFMAVLDEIGEVTIGRDKPLTQAIVESVPDGAPPVNEMLDEDHDLRAEAIEVLGEHRHKRQARLVRSGLRQLPRLEQFVIRWRYGLDCDRLSRAQVARRLGVSPSQAWNIECSAMAQLEHAVERLAEQQSAARQRAKAARRSARAAAAFAA